MGFFIEINLDLLYLNLVQKKLFIKTYGCQMNVYDSHKMADVMGTVGYALTDNYFGADMVILNTCHIREKASEKTYSELGRIRKEKTRMQREDGRNMVIAVAGCVAQAEGEEIFARAPYVDIVVGPQTFHQMPELLARADRKAGRKISLDFAANEKFDALPIASRTQGSSAFLTVQEGCDKFCTFCVVPYTRGAEFSRSFNEIIDEAKRLADDGAIEINLLGQNVNAYHGDGKTLADLIYKIAELPQIKRIRYTTSHPRDMQDDLIAAHGSVPKLMPWLHLPIQSGSDEVLQKMNRKHNAQFYLDIISRLRKANPALAFSSDFIVGFPGETEKHFEETMELVRQVGYAQCYSFKYSPRPGTPGAALADSVPEEVKSERLLRLQAFLGQQQSDFNKAFIGHKMQVLLDRKGKFENQLLGKTEYMQSVHLKTELANFGNLVEVMITGATLSSLSGEIVGDENLGLAA